MYRWCKRSVRWIAIIYKIFKRLGQEACDPKPRCNQVSSDAGSRVVFMEPTLFSILNSNVGWYEQFWPPLGKKPVDLVKQDQFWTTRILKVLESHS